MKSFTTIRTSMIWIEFTARLTIPGPLRAGATLCPHDRPFTASAQDADHRSSSQLLRWVPVMVVVLADEPDLLTDCTQVTKALRFGKARRLLYF
jgi:hypothetical protein